MLPSSRLLFRTVTIPSAIRAAPFVGCRAAVHPSGTGSSRPFATTPLERLQAILDEYQRENYQQDLPSRFIKEVVKAADRNKDGMIDVEELQTLLRHINSKDMLSREEIESAIQKELGYPDATQVPIDVVVKHFLTRKANEKKK